MLADVLILAGTGWRGSQRVGAVSARRGGQGTMDQLVWKNQTNKRRFGGRFSACGRNVRLDDCLVWYWLVKCWGPSPPPHCMAWHQLHRQLHVTILSLELQECSMGRWNMSLCTGKESLTTRKTPKGDKEYQNIAPSDTLPPICPAQLLGFFMDRRCALMQLVC